MIEPRDELTGLRTRAGFLSLLQQRIIQAGETRSMLALVVIDVDGFAQINVASGYNTGDAVLRHLGRQLRAVARKQDAVARIGDNRFVLLLTRVLNHGHVALAVQKLERLMEAPMQFGENRIVIQITAGAALCPEHASHAEYLMRKAETALAAARIENRKYLMAEIALPGRGLSDQWEMEMELEGAIDRGELEMYYQPQIRMHDQHTVGAEALMRWNRRGREIIPPDTFIPLAERSGQIKKVTIWALNTVLRQAGEWRKDLGPLTVSVNLPGELAIQHDLPELVENAMHLWGKKHIKLMLEITERSLMDRARSRNILLQLRELGARISIDDFGTGYSCLAYFKNIPADELKIDKSFVIEMRTDSGSADITTLIIDLAHRFNLEVVAEGIENTETFELLKAKGCDIAQGFLFGKPMPQEAFQAWLDTQTPAATLRKAGDDH